MTAPVRTRSRLPYTMLIPAGWASIPVGRGSRQAIEKVLDRSLPAGNPQLAVRRQLSDLLTKQVRAAAAQHGVAIYLPVDRVHGVTIPASVVVSTPVLDADQQPMDVLLAVAARNPGAEVLDIGGHPAVRTELAAVPDAEGGDGVPVRSRRITYHLADPADASRYVVLAATVLVGEGAGGVDVADAVTDLVDAMVTTFRWLPQEVRA